jgi:hypothetical protein
VPETTALKQEVAKSTAETSDRGLDVEDRASEILERAAPKTVAPRRGFRLAWVPVVLIAGGIVYFLWQPQFEQMARRISERGTEASAPRAEPSEVLPPSVPAAAPADTPTRASGVAAAPAEPVASKPILPPKKSMAELKPESTAPKPAPVAAAAAPEPGARQVRKPEKTAAKSPAIPAASAPDTHELRKPGAVAAKPAEAQIKPTPIKPAPAESPKPQLPARDPVAAAAPAGAVATAPVAAPVQRPAEAVSGPVLRINVRSEAQRAWAKQMIGPLKERGIHVAAIRLVPPHAEIAHIRYYRAAERSEAMRIAATLSDLGLSARQLRQLDEVAGSTAARQYELWLAAEEDR